MDSTTDWSCVGTMRARNTRPILSAALGHITKTPSLVSKAQLSHSLDLGLRLYTVVELNEDN